MKTLKLNALGGLDVTGGNLAIAQDMGAAMQDLTSMIKLHAGENPDDTNEGINYLTPDINKLGGMNFITESIRKRVLSHPEVTNIDSIKTKTDGDNFTLTLNIQTIYGRTTL